MDWSRSISFMMYSFPFWAKQMFGILTSKWVKPKLFNSSKAVAVINMKSQRHFLTSSSVNGGNCAGNEKKTRHPQWRQSDNEVLCVLDYYNSKRCATLEQDVTPQDMESTSRRYHHSSTKWSVLLELDKHCKQANSCNEGAKFELLLLLLHLKGA